MLTDDIESVKKLKRKMPTQYIIMFISAGIGFTFLVLGTLD
jgi:hypothetical protein